MLSTTINRAQGSSFWKRLGKIKLGKKEKKQNGQEYPVDLEYFVIPEEFKAKLGAEPTELSICLAFPTFKQNYDTRAAMYKSNGAKACWTTDDITAHRYMIPEGSTKYAWVTMPCPNVECEFRKAKKCPPRGMFSFMIPDCGEIGTFFLQTGSIVAQDRIYTSLKAVEDMCRNRAQGMFGIRMKLRREKTTFMVDFNGNGQQSAVVKYIPTLDIDFKSLLAADQAMLAPFMGMQLALAPKTATPEELEDKDSEEEDEFPFGDPNDPKFNRPALELHP